jgi:hypothetical protein
MTRPSRSPQAAAERRQWKKFGEAVHEKAGDSVTVRATEDIPFERVRLAKTTQEQKTQMDVATALAAGDKAAVGTRFAPHRLQHYSGAAS